MSVKKKNKIDDFPKWMRIVLIVIVIAAFVKFFILYPTGPQRQSFPSHNPPTPKK